jgi:phenylalanine-4-hydroxylase
LSTYCEAIGLLSPHAEAIPSLSEINSWLCRVGWEAIYYSGFVPATEYADLQARKIFPIARHIRKSAHFSHSAAPDFLHDLFGHLPMLFEEQYSNLIQVWAYKRMHTASEPEDVALAVAQDALIAAMEQTARDSSLVAGLTKALENAQAAACKAASRAGRLERFYTWAMEYGMMTTGWGGRKIMGAAILSSLGETQRVIGGQVRFLKMQSDTLNRPVNYTVYQDEVFETSSFPELVTILDAI